MTEFQEQTAKEGFQTANAKYMSLAEEPLIGGEGDKAYRKSKVIFHIDNKQNPNKFIIWTPLKSVKAKYKSDEELTQFKRYNIVWVEENKEYNGNKWVEKKIVIINDPDESLQNNTQQNSNNTQSTNNSVDIKPDAKFQEAVLKYIEAIKPIIKAKPEEKANLMVGTRMLGSVLTQIHPDTYKALLMICDDTLLELEKEL